MSQSLAIVHCFRSPVGGIFRHVRDLIAEQKAAGHRVGVICDDNTGGEFEEKMMAQLESDLDLGLHRVTMDRAISPSDLKVMFQLTRLLRSMDLDILHSHGAKGGAYARLIGSVLGWRSRKPARLYCPHGGSVHYDTKTMSGRVYGTLERLLERFTDRLVFVCEYEQDGYLAKVPNLTTSYSIVRNGITEPEFEHIKPAEDASDLLYIGMMRDLKGVDVFLDALPIVAERLNKKITATLVGDGPDLERYKQVAAGLAPQVETRFFDPMPARVAFPLGKTLVVPSRAESMPYIVLEALAAQIPLLATRVGGIPEILTPFDGHLIPAGDPQEMAKTMIRHLEGSLKLPDPEELAQLVHDRHSSSVMAADVMKAYEAAMDS
ncbi:glycosyltransferase family 4 protein [Ahrensia sp. R2A130]|uniref:glycosyltransferase family 4 protein n=1 Tax=Ahrensia sp. R2A130 TaxID=744979 RepID=UPI0001E083AD|nr:glycosyltransferase family 4 protein [Ahrensia sp. R2A130]EFL90513.1 glycosyl transferase [Ahrensia sp. R2A130]